MLNKVKHLLKARISGRSFTPFRMTEQSNKLYLLTPAHKDTHGSCHNPAPWGRIASAPA